jgi:ribosome-associated protein
VGQRPTVLAEVLKMQEITITTEFIKLQQAIKLAHIVGEGSEAKMLVLDGQATVNGEVCLMRGKKLRDGDVFSVNGYGEFRIKGE